MKFVIFTIRGLGDTNEEKHKDIEQKLQSAFSAELNAEVIFHPLLYHQVFEDNQATVWEKILETNGKRMIHKRLMRKFLLGFMGDATTYLHAKEKSDSVYQNVHQYIANEISSLKNSMPEDSPIVIIAQSLGVQIITDYIWDLQKSLLGDKIGIWNNRDLPISAFEKMVNIRFLFSSGCNVPLFVSGLNCCEAISKPNANFEWINYFDRDDVLGWPLKQLSKTGVNGVVNGYNEAVKEDICINTGRSVLSHLHYWKRRKYYKNVAALIKEWHNIV